MVKSVPKSVIRFENLVRNNTNYDVASLKEEWIAMRAYNKLNGNPWPMWNLFLVNKIGWGRNANFKTALVEMEAKELGLPPPKVHGYISGK